MMTVTRLVLNRVTACGCCTPRVAVNARHRDAVTDPNFVTWYTVTVTVYRFGFDFMLPGSGAQ